jgi:hypothetical protein
MLSADRWLVASQRLLREAGRARMHDLRGNLNMASLGAELLSDPEDDADDDTASARAIQSVQRAVEHASEDVTALHALIVEATEPTARPLSDAAAWAVDAAKPVARRRNLEVAMPSPIDGLARIDAPTGLSVVLAYALVEAYLEATRRSTCLMDAGTLGSSTLTVEWTPAPEADRGPVETASETLRALLNGRGRVSLELDAERRRLVCAFHPITGDSRRPVPGGRPRA